MRTRRGNDTTAIERGTYDQLSHKGVLCHVAREARPKPDSIRFDVQMRLNESDGRLFQVELVTSGERMFDPVRAERLLAPQGSAPSVASFSQERFQKGSPPAKTRGGSSR